MGIYVYDSYYQYKCDKTGTKSKLVNKLTFQWTSCAKRLTVWQLFSKPEFLEVSHTDFYSHVYLKVLCYLQFLKNTEYVRIVLIHFEQLINPIISARTMRIL